MRGGIDERQTPRQVRETRQDEGGAPPRYLLSLLPVARVILRDESAPSEKTSK